MRNLTKKIMIYSMVGMMQLGLGATVGATVIEASPFHNDGSQIVQLSYDHNDRQYRHDERQRHENYRHEREMRRRDHESRRDWNDRQWRENQRHDNTMNEIEAGMIGFILGSVIN
jgi:hypothetical protein